MAAQQPRAGLPVSDRDVHRAGGQRAQLSAVVAELAHVDLAEAAQALHAVEQPDGADRAVTLATLTNRIRQAPARHATRTRALALVGGDLAEVSSGELAAAVALLRTRPPRFPTVAGPVVLPALDTALAETFVALGDLDNQVPQPWTLIGGLMVLVHCAEHDVSFTRPTVDADVAAGVFTHRQTLARLTAQLAAAGFSDVTPAPLTGGPALSYRWSRGRLRIDVVVPPHVNEEHDPPRSATARASVEMPAVQQAIARSERVQLVLASGQRRWVRRPDLLGALVIKAQAAASDRRDPDRHREDLVALCQAMAVSGSHVGYRGQLRTKDRRRLRAAGATLTAAHWRRASEPDAAREALDFLLA